ncbi:MAG: DUF3160 domain-containing protein [Actinomycetota bacterium]|nr:DUF3160 domain-containing protein [Actinomycetota bacterium]
MRRAIAMLVSILMIAAACTTSAETTTSETATTEPTTTTSSASLTSTTAETTTTTATTTTLAPTGESVFPGNFGATLEDIPLISEGTYAGPEWPDSLDGVAFVDGVPPELHDVLITNGFAVELNSDTYEWAEALTWSTQFSAKYEALSPYGGRAVFVTTDAAYHLWHQVFDLVLRHTETHALLPVLERLVGNLVEASREQTAASVGADIEDAALRAQEHLEAVATVLELGVGSIGDRAAAEVALVEAHTELVESPTVGGDCPFSCVDYSRMKPRGHYTRTEDLQRFFKAMSMLGNTMFLVGNAHTLRVGALISRLIVASPENIQDWTTIYDPTAFLVGTADDYTPLEIEAAANAVIDAGLADPTALSDDSVMLAIGQELLAMRPVRIDPGLAALRTMGTRFVLDSWIYDQLTHSGVENRERPTPLDLASVMGSEYSAGIQDEAGESATYPDYEPKVAALGVSTEARTIEDWGRTVYDGWLYALEPMWGKQHPDAFPPFMRATAWQAKSHNTGFASYAELKHDTILYGKEAMVEGEAPEPPPPPRHWVEPDPVAFGRLAALTRMTRDGLIDGGLMLAGDYDTRDGNPWEDREVTRWASEYLLEILDRLERLAQDELDAKPISADDNEWLSYIGSRFAWLVEAISRGEKEPTPIIADIFLNPFADEVLEVGTGPLDTIHVLVPDDDGGFQVATGPIYSYYEFWGPRSERLSDEEWWDRITEGQLPERPSWWTDELG